MDAREKLRSILSYDPMIGEFRWKTSISRCKAGDVAGRIDRQGYVRIGLDGRQYLGHRVAWLFMTGDWPNGHLDHENLCKSDNRWRNIRIATPTENNANWAKGTRNTSGFKGVTWNKQSRKWQASIKVDRKSIYLGLFTTAEDAHVAYRQAAERFFGEFARAA